MCTRSVEQFICTSESRIRCTERWEDELETRAAHIRTKEQRCSGKSIRRWMSSPRALSGVSRSLVEDRTCKERSQQCHPSLHTLAPRMHLSDHIITSMKDSDTMDSMATSRNNRHLLEEAIVMVLHSDQESYYPRQHIYTCADLKNSKTTHRHRIDGYDRFVI